MKTTRIFLSYLHSPRDEQNSRGLRRDFLALRDEQNSRGLRRDFLAPRDEQISRGLRREILSSIVEIDQREKLGGNV